MDQLLKDVRDSWVRLVQALGSSTDKKTTMKILKAVLKTQEESLKAIKFMKKSVFIGDLTNLSEEEIAAKFVAAMEGEKPNDTSEL